MIKKMWLNWMANMGFSILWLIQSRVALNLLSLKQSRDASIGLMCSREGTKPEDGLWERQRKRWARNAQLLFLSMQAARRVLPLGEARPGVGLWLQSFNKKTPPREVVASWHTEKTWDELRKGNLLISISLDVSFAYLLESLSSVHLVTSHRMFWV